MKDNIESKFHDLAKRQSTTPPTFVWDNIEEVLHPKSSRRGGFLLFFGLLAGVVIAGFVLFKWNANKPETKSISIVANEIVESNNQLNSNIEKEDVLSTENINSSLTSELLENNIQSQSLSLSKTKNITSNDKLNQVTNSDELDNNSLLLMDEDDLNNNNNNNASNNLAEINEVSTRQDIQFSKISILHPSKLENDSKLKYLIKDEVECPSFNRGKKLSGFATLGLLGGMHSKSISDGTNSILAAKRNQSESPWYSYGISVAAGINFSPQFYAGAGIDWTQSKDKFYNESEAITKMIITFDPNSGQAIDTSFVTGKLINKGEIRYNSLDIPIFIGFHKAINNWSFGVEAGALFNVNFKVRGKIYNQTLSISTIEDESIVYKNKLNLGIKASIVVRKHLSNGLSLELKPTFRTYLNNINDSAYALPMKMSVYGLYVGLRKDF